MKKDQIKINLKEAFEEYARKEIEFYQSAEKDKLYNRILPNIKEKDTANVDFYWNGVIIGGYIHDKDLVLNKMRLTKYGKEEEIPRAIDAIEKALEGSAIVLDNQLKQYNNHYGYMVATLMLHISVQPNNTRQSLKLQIVSKNISINPRKDNNHADQQNQPKEYQL